MYTEEDIEIFILTHNRAQMLKDSVQSILNQSLKSVSVTIMDNCSDDNTKEVVEDFQKQYSQVKYFRHEKLSGRDGNITKAIELASKEYLMLFHDDDILHPDYLKLGLAAINKYKNVAVVSTVYTATEAPTLSGWKSSKSKLDYLQNKKEFATYMYRVGGFGFPPTIYKSKNLKTTKIEHDKYGKIADKPFVLNALKANDGAVIFRNPDLLKYRVHAGQDTNVGTGNPSYSQIINHNNFFKEEMGYSPYSRFMYELVCYKRLKSCYEIGNDLTLSLKEFIDKAMTEGSSSILCKLSNNKMSEPFVKPLTSLLRKIFNARCKKNILEVPPEKMIAVCSTSDIDNNCKFLDFETAKNGFGMLINYHIAKAFPNNKVVSGDVAYNMFKNKEVNPKDILIVSEQLSDETKKMLRGGALGVWANCFECLMYARSYYIRLNYWSKKFKHVCLFKGAYKMFTPRKGLDTNIAYFPSYDRSEIILPKDLNERGFAVMVVSNKFYNHKKMRRYRKLLIENELQNKRLEAIEFFAQKKALKLCGHGWKDISNLPQMWQERLKVLIEELNPHSIEDKIGIISNYKFNLCIENMEFEGYVTEKIIHSLVAGAVPVYLGAEDIEDFVPKNCFIHIRDFKSLDELFEHMNSLSEAEIKTYIDNGRAFLDSEAGRKFDCKVVADKIIDALKNEIKV